MINRKARRKLIEKAGRRLKGTVRALKKSGTGSALKSAGVFASFGAVMYLKNRLLPMYADDYPYAFIWDGENNGNLAFGNQKYIKVKNLKNLIQSQISHYKTWDGRTLAESLVQISLIPEDKKYFDRLNTLMLLLQPWLSASIAKGKPVNPLSLSPKEALLLTAGFFGCAPHLSATCFWITGAMNYLWMGILQSLFVLPYSMHYHGNKVSLPGALSFLSGLLSGWSTETGAGASLLFASMETLHALKSKKYEAFMGWGLAGAVLGLLLLIMAPGNRRKLETEYDFSHTTPDDLMSLPGYVSEEYLYTPVMFMKWFKEGFLTTILRELPLQLPVIAYFLKGKRDHKTDIYIAGLETVIFAIPSVMMLSPEYPRRATYASIIYLLAAALIAANRLDIPPFAMWSSRAKCLGISAAAAYALWVLSSLIVDADVRDQIEKQIRFIKVNIDKPLVRVKDILVPPFYEAIAGDRSITWDTTMGIGMDSADNPYNKAAAAYLGANRIECDQGGDHVYELKDIQSRLFGIINPLKSFIRWTVEAVFGISDDRDRRDVICYPIKHYGSNYGGHFVYEKPLKECDRPIVYSFGTGEDLSFSETILKRTNAEIFAYDPNPASVAFVKSLPIYKDPRFHFTEAGVSERDEDGFFYKPIEDEDYSGSIYNYSPDLDDEGIPVKLYSLKTLLEMNGHRHIHLLKMDIEGAEFGVISSLKDLDVKIDQICMETHERFFGDYESKIADMVRVLHELGYVIIYSDGHWNDYTFLLTDQTERTVSENTEE